VGARLIKGCFDVHVVVSDLEQSLRFWSGTMGFETEEVVDLPGGNKQFRLRNGNALVKLMTRGEHPLAPLYDADGYRGLTFGVSNFEETVEPSRRAARAATASCWMRAPPSPTRTAANRSACSRTPKATSSSSSPPQTRSERPIGASPTELRILEGPGATLAADLDRVRRSAAGGRRMVDHEQCVATLFSEPEAYSVGPEGVSRVRGFGSRSNQAGRGGDEHRKRVRIAFSNVPSISSRGGRSARGRVLPPSSGSSGLRGSGP